MKNIVIIGASHAASEAISALRKQGWQGGITLIGDEQDLPYQRPPLSKAYYKGDVNVEKLLIKQASFYQDSGIDLYLSRRAESIERSAKQVLLDNGESIAYDKLIIATGTRPRLLPVAGSDLPQVKYLRTRADVDEIKTSLPEGSHLLIVGAGYIGLEVAASASAQGMNVTVLEAMDRVLERVTSPEISNFYQQLHSDAGVDIRLGVSLKEFVNEGDDTVALLATESEQSPEEIPFDVAIVGIGVVPNVELAEQAGLPCDNGILVDEFTRTIDPDVYAIGDVSNHPSHLYNRNIRLESVPNAIGQAKTAAASICGNDSVYNEVPWFWSDQYDVKLQTVGLLSGYDQAVVRGDVEQKKFSVFYLQQGRLIAMDAVNSPADFMLSKKAVMAQCHPDPSALADVAMPIKEVLF